MTRDYSKLRGGVIERLTESAPLEQRMRIVVDVLWEGLHMTGVSWVGFYQIDPSEQQMTLGPRRDKPACSPIGMYGACGQAFISNQPLVVRDVHELGPNYIACDPKDRSEVVIPIQDAQGRPMGVLDLDSHDIGSFTDTDVSGLTDILRAAGLAP